jgi:steroid delta-isomerase-like uncharacterized protein
MQNDENSLIARKVHEVWADRKPEQGAALIAEDCEFLDVARREIIRGPEGFLHDYKRWRTAFPDGTIEVTKTIASGEWAVVEYLNRGTNTGPLRSAVGDFPPTGRKIEVQYCDVMQIRNRKVIGGRCYYDVSTILRQLGMLNK